MIYIAKDSSGNETSKTRVITVQDVNAPVITLNGYDPINTNVGEPYTEPGATALDDVDGDLTSSIVITGTVNPNVPGTYTITYTVTDSSGNKTTVIRTVNVVDNIPPVITFGTNGNSTWSKSHSTTVTVTDVHSSVNSSSLKYLWSTSSSGVVEGNFSTGFTSGSTITNNTATGDYYLWVLAKDTAGNTKIERSNVFKLDNTYPVVSGITINASNVSYDSFKVTRSGNASDSHSGLATNPYIYQISLNGSSWETKCTNNTTECSVSGLNPETTYYYRVCAVDKLSNQSCLSSKSVYTASLPFVCGQTITDSRDGSTYKTTQIGNQCWFAKNLKYTGNGCQDKSWGNSSSTRSSCAVFNNIYAGGTVVLYQWNAAMNGSTVEGAQGLCPDGWHIPSRSEFNDLIDYVEYAGTLKNANWGGNNTYGFNARPTGRATSPGSLEGGNSEGYWWSSSTIASDPTGMHMNSVWPQNIYIVYTSYDGFAVRCIKNS